eukprot:1968175-Alexandrium_andersonii.AAC.1
MCACLQAFRTTPNGRPPAAVSSYCAGVASTVAMGRGRPRKDSEYPKFRDLDEAVKEFIRQRRNELKDHRLEQ